MITTAPTMSRTFERWTELQNLDEILARSRARYKNSSRSKSVPTKKTASQNNKSRYVRNRGPKMPPGKEDDELKRAVQNDVNMSTPSIRNNGPGTYVEHELPATDNNGKYEGPERRKKQPGRFSTDLYHITSRDIASQNAGPMPPLEQDLLSPTVDEDIYSPNQSHIRQFRKLNSFLGIDDDTPPSRQEKHSQLDTAREALEDWELFEFELDQPKYQDTVSNAVLELEGSSISNISDPSEVCEDIPPILRPGRPPPVESVSNEPLSQVATVERAATFPLPNGSPSELFLPCHERSKILWSQPSRQRLNLRGYIASMRERHSIAYKTYKKPESKPSRVLEYPKQITLTKPTPTSSPIESPFQLVDQGLLMPPPRLYKKKSRHQKLIADSIYVKELRVRRLSHMNITDEEFVARRESITQEVMVVLGD